MKTPTIELDPGQIEFKIDHDGETKTWNVDCVVLKLAAEEIERQHRLGKDEFGALIVTAEFFRDLASRYIDEGCPVCTPEAAKQLWIFINEKHETLIQNVERQLAKIR